MISVHQVPFALLDAGPFQKFRGQLAERRLVHEVVFVRREHRRRQLDVGALVLAAGEARQALVVVVEHGRAVEGVGVVTVTGVLDDLVHTTET